MRGLNDALHFRTSRLAQRRYRAIDDDEEIDEIVADNPRPEDWLPTVLEDVCQDIMKVLEALDSVRATGSLNSQYAVTLFIKSKRNRGENKTYQISTFLWVYGVARLAIIYPGHHRQ